MFVHFSTVSFFQTRDWRKPLSAAVDAYREMLRIQEEVKMTMLDLTKKENLAMTCPRCFGPTVEGKRPAEPDFIVCLDGNFQHRRHKAASAAWRPSKISLPSLFLSNEYVDDWAKKHTEGNQTSSMPQQQINQKEDVIVSFLGV